MSLPVYVVKADYETRRFLTELEDTGERWTHEKFLAQWESDIREIVNKGSYYLIIEYV